MGRGLKLGFRELKLGFTGMKLGFMTDYTGDVGHNRFSPQITWIITEQADGPLSVSRIACVYPDKQ